MHSHGNHTHHHGTLDPSVVATEQGIRAVKYSFLILAATALFQIYIAAISGSVALFADTIHNIADACTAIPLWIAFTLARRKPSSHFTYGYGRFEDLAGLAILAIIVASAASIGYESFNRLMHPQQVTNLPAVILAGLVGCIGNNIVARYRIRVGEKIKSTALIADGYHAHLDSFTSLAVLFSALGVMAGFPQADALVALCIMIVLVKIIYTAGKAVLERLLDRIDPKVVAAVKNTAKLERAVMGIPRVRARWIGHELHVELSALVSRTYSIEEGHHIAHRVSDLVATVLPHASHIIVHIEAAGMETEDHAHTIGNAHT